MFEPENDLERSLMKAATNPSHRPQFYRDLLGSVVFVINANPQPLAVQDGVLQQGAQVAIQPWERNGMSWLPIFSSLSRLQQSLQVEATYLQLNARDFFELTSGANVVLNPGLDYGKEFLPEEIAGMLDSSVFRAGSGYRVEQETKVLLGQPAKYPTELVTALSRLFTKHRGVKAAYLAHFFNASRDEAPHTLIGIDSEGDWDSIVGEAGMVAQNVLASGEIVDFLRVSKSDSGPSQYLLNETKPFYRRSLLGLVF